MGDFYSHAKKVGMVYESALQTESLLSLVIWQLLHVRAFPRNAQQIYSHSGKLAVSTAELTGFPQPSALLKSMGRISPGSAEPCRKAH